MKIYMVTDGHYVNDYFQKEENAQKAVDEINLFIDENKDNPSCHNMRLDKYFVETIETAD